LTDPESKSGEHAIGTLLKKRPEFLHCDESGAHQFPIRKKTTLGLANVRDILIA